jgi:glycosyltransferase involved in cell wall biosynthesis
MDSSDRDSLVSVILPVYNGERFVAEALDSALRQTYGHLEVVVVDDGSVDGTRELIATRAASDSRVRIITQANQGLAAARNRGLQHASGELIAPLDADDVWEPTKLERQVRRIVDSGPEVGFVYCWWVSIDGQGAMLDRSPRWLIEGRAEDALLQVNYTGAASVPLFHRRALEVTGPYDVTLDEGCEDWDLVLRVAERFRVAVVPAVLVAYRRHRGSMSTQTRRMWRSHQRVMTRARQRRQSLSDVTVRRSRQQFALYLSGVCYRCGEFGRAISWGLRAMPSRLALRVLPHVARMVANKGRPRHGSSPAAIRAGVAFCHWDMPAPAIPYDRIYAPRLSDD